MFSITYIEYIMQKIYLGKITTGEFQNEPIWLTKHSWDCGWYWSFGYIGNRNLHTHFNYQFMKDWEFDITKVLTDTKLNQQDWDNIMDLFKQAYALKNAAKIYQYGGHISTNEVTKVVRSEEIARQLNNDLEKILDRLWEYLLNVTSK